MLLTHRKLTQLCKEGVIENYKQSAINAASIDVHLGEKIYLPKRTNITELDLIEHKHSIEQFFDSYRIGFEGFLLQPWQFWLGSTVEKFNLPNNIAAEYKLKSSQARLGQNHLLAGWCDPGWNNSRLTMEFVNHLPFPVRIYPGMPIGQIVFWEGEEVCSSQSYATKGRYNNQTDTQLSKGIYGN